MVRQSIKDFLGFIQYTHVVDLISGFNIFRGQPAEKQLVPSIARKDPSVDTTSMEKELLNQLQLYGASLLGSGLKQLELLVLARHFGLKTRLLDWTSNPLAALWFACSAQNWEEDVCVYALDAESLLQKDVYEKDPFSISELLVFQPRLNDPRLIAQHSWFTLHPYLSTDQRFISLESDHEKNLTEIRIPAASRHDILHSLDLHGISIRTLFPDLQGLCQYLNMKHDV